MSISTDWIFEVDATAPIPRVDDEHWPAGHARPAGRRRYVGRHRAVRNG